MKKMLFAAAFILAAVPLKSATGGGFLIDNLSFTITSEDGSDSKECAVSGYSGTSGYVVIPESVTFKAEDETETVYTVTSIADEAFMGNGNLFKVDFPNTITAIGAHAFEDCAILSFEEFPENLLSIGNYAFKGCNAIKRIKLPEST
ncbi:MAG: leucine-rich repeat domain-containing protein, partial [Muribaculum sp.]|nr:leucine-rich repeat domain-containing protein [Muribaculum sp.]